MADISDSLDKILTEKNLKNVLNAIYDGIINCYDEIDTPEISSEGYVNYIQNQINLGILSSWLLVDGSIEKSMLDDELQDTIDSLGLIVGIDGNLYRLVIDEDDSIKAEKVVE